MRSPRICWFLHKILWFLTSSDFVFINYSSNIVLVSIAEAKPSLTFLIPMECTHGFWSWRRKLLALMRHSKKRSAFISFFFWTATIQYGNTKLIFFCVFSEADCLHFFPSIIKEESRLKKGFGIRRRYFFVYFTIENRIMMSSIALPIRMFLALATEKSTILEELEERVWGYKEFPMLSNHRIPSNVGVFIAFGIGGHGIAGNGHSHLNQIVSWNVHKHQLKSWENREPFF